VDPDGQERTQSLVKPLSGGWTTWWSAMQGDLQRRGGGVCISINDKARYKVTSSGTLVEGRALYVLLKWNRLQIGVLNIYAPNSTPKREIFWRMLVTTLPDAEAWVMAGDFNMTEHLRDRKGGT
jgi:endonuclease/exonuclease/phosphatase family metal-dependent hydrolase